MTVKLSPGQRTFTRVMTDRTGTEITIRVVIDEGAALDRVIKRLANKVRSSKTQRAASAADGVIHVTLERDRAAITPYQRQLIADGHCMADDDGDCGWMKAEWECPQLRDGEPKKTGRHCPRDIHDADDEGKAGNG